MINVQKNIDANGDVIAGDKNTNIYFSDSQIHQLVDLCKQLESDYENDVTTEQINDDMNYYGIPAPNNPDLSEKLEKANLSPSLIRAIDKKDLFRRRLEKYRYFSAAQRIFCVLMAALLHNFETYAMPAISKGITGEDLQVLVAEKVVEPIAAKMPASVMDLHHDAIWGILYFLTGNCFINWSK